MAMLGRTEHAFGAPKYIINRYNAHLAKFRFTVYTQPKDKRRRDTVIHPTSLHDYKFVIERISGVDQHTLFTTGKVTYVSSRKADVHYDIEFVGFQA